MTMVSFGDLARSFLLRNNISRLKTQVQSSANELGSGRVNDVGKTVKGDHKQLSSISRNRQLAQGYQAATKDLTIRSTAVQNIITSLNTESNELIGQLLSAPIGAESGQSALISNNASQRLESIISNMNSSIGGRNVLGGTMSSGKVVISAEEILAHLKSEISGLSTPEETLSRVQQWFDSPNGYQNVAYFGGTLEDPVAISEVDRVSPAPTANHPAFRQLLAAVATAALINDTSLNMGNSLRADLAQKSGEALSSAQNTLLALGANVGLSQARLETARMRNDTILSSSETAQADILASDQYRAAIELEAAQSNLEALYSITARLSELSLAKVMR